jgi:hypothetical protein
MPYFSLTVFEREARCGSTYAEAATVEKDSSSGSLGGVKINLGVSDAIEIGGRT